MRKLQLQGMPASSWIPNAVVLFATWEAWTGKQAELFGAQFELLFCIPYFHASSWFTRSSLSFSVSPSLGSFAQPWCHGMMSISRELDLPALWPFDLLNNLPGIWYYDVTMEAVKNSPYEYSRIRLLSLACPCSAWISSRECSRRALSLPAMNN